MRISSVSVVVPTFDDADRLEQGLASIIAQSSPPDEVIVCDDCSQDRTGEVVGALARRQQSVPIRYLRLDEPGGVVAARNHGIREANGEWIATCDSDDLWLPDKLARQRSFIAAWRGRPLSILGTYGYNVSDAGRVLSPVTMGPATEADYESIRAAHGVFYLLHSSIVFPRERFDEVGGYTTEYGFADDCDFWTRMSEVGVVLALSEPLVHYRKRAGSIQLARFSNKEEGVERLVENRKRAGQNLPLLSAEAYRAQLAAAPLMSRLGRRCRFLGAYHYRVGAACAVNGERARGLMHLLMATLFDRRRLIAGLKRTLAHRLSTLRRTG